jgi:hypothetical protein
VEGGEVVVGVGVLGAELPFVVTVTKVDVDDGTKTPPPEPKSALTPSKKPAFAYTWLMSQIMTPPKLENCSLYEMTLARAFPEV